jgi:molybdate transport system substrate-binding protein
MDGGGCDVAFDFDATPRIAARIEAGAPADLFFSADVRWMDALAAKDLVRPGTRVDLLGNRLVLAVPRGSAWLPRDPADLAAGGGRIALAGENVPAGRYARQALESAGAWDAIAPRVVAGDSVRTVLSWVARREVPAGVVYSTDVLVEPRVVAAFTFQEDLHDPVVYPVAVATGAARPDDAAAFVAFCRGAGRSLFEEAGFAIRAGAVP